MLWHPPGVRMFVGWTCEGRVSADSWVDPHDPNSRPGGVSHWSVRDSASTGRLFV